MTSKDTLHRDLKNLSEELLGGLSSAERIQMFAKAAADNNDEFIEELWATAPKKRYELPELASRSGARTVFLLSALVYGELVRLETEMRVHKAERDRAMALVLLHEALSRLSNGQFSVDEYGDIEIPDSWPEAYGPKYDPETSKLATKFRALFESTALELPISVAERSPAYFPELAACSLLAYRDDLSDEAFDDLPDFSHSEAFQSEVLLIHTVVEFYRTYHGWRIVAEDHIGISFDEFLGVAQPEDDYGGMFATAGGTPLDQDQCETILSLHQLHLDAYEDVFEALSIHFDEASDSIGLDEQVEEYVAALAPVIEKMLSSDSD